MAIEYFCCYHSYLKKCEKLTDQELGRLFRALLTYSSTGERQELAGRESIAFDFIADDIDRAKASYESNCRKNAENGKKGGRPGKRPVFEKPKKADGFLETQKSQNKDKDKDEYKGKDEGMSPPPPPALGDCGFGPELSAAFCDWLQYKRERREEYKPTGLRSLVTQVQKQAEQHGETAVAELIRQCMAANWRGIIFDRLDKSQEKARASSGNIFMEMLREEENRGES